MADFYHLGCVFYFQIFLIALADLVRLATTFREVNMSWYVIVDFLAVPIVQHWTYLLVANLNMF